MNPRRLRSRIAILLGLLLSGLPAAHAQQAQRPENESPAPIAVPPAGTRRVRVSLPESASPERFLAQHGLEGRVLSERMGRLLDVALTDAEIEWLRDLGHELDVLPPEDSLAGPTLYTYGQMVSEILALEAAHPSIVDVTSYPDATHDGRTLYELKLSDNVDDEEDEPTVFFVGVHHGGEMIGCDILMFWLTDTLANYGVDPVKTAWIDDNEIRVIVIGNPDGWMNNETGLTNGWRKNNRDNNGSGSFESNADGVDLNRNFDFNWLLNGSGSPSNSTYRGPNPASEPEVQICQSILLANRPTLAVSWHMSGQIIYLPWTWNGMHTPDHAAYMDYAQSIGDSIPKQNGVGTYPPVTETRIGGFIDDWIYGVLGGLCVTVEVTWSAGVTTIGNVVANNQGSYPVVFQRMAGPQVTGVVTDAVSGAPLAAKIELLEIDTSNLPDRSSDLEFGRYRWMTLPGTYTLRVTRPGYHGQTLSNVVVSGAGPTLQNVALIPHFSSRGNGLAGSGGLVPMLSGSGTPVIGSAVGLEVTQGLGGALALFALGNAPASQPLFGGTLLVASPFTTRVRPLAGAAGVPGAGSTQIAGSLPDDPALQGRTFHAQCMVVDPGGPQGRSLSAALETRVE